MQGKRFWGAIVLIIGIWAVAAVAGADCGLINNSDLRHYCRGDCGLINKPDLRYL
jgi:hypothetical protein